MLPPSPPPQKVKPPSPPKRVSSLGKPIVASVKNTTHVPANKNTENSVAGISEASTEINATDISEASTEISATDISEASTEISAIGISEASTSTESNAAGISEAGESKHSESTAASDLETRPYGRLVRKPVTYSISRSVAYNRSPAFYTGEPVPIVSEESSQSLIRSDTLTGQNKPSKRVNVLPSSQSGTAARSSFLTGALLSSQLRAANRFSHPTSAPFSSKSGTVHRSSRPSGRPLSSQQRPVHYLPFPQNAVHPPHQEGKDRQHVRRVDVPPSGDSPLKFKPPKDDPEQK